MKLIKSLALVAALGAATSSAFAAFGVVNDLVVGFTNSATSTVDVEINAGQLSSLSTPGTHVIGNFASLLNSTFGTDWSQVSFAGVSISKLTPGGNEYVTSKWLDNTGTLGVANSATFGTEAQGAINSGITKVVNVYNGVVTGNTIAISDTKSFAKNLWFNQTATLAQAKIGDVTASGAFAASDLYLIKAGVDTATQFQGTLAVYGNGDVTFTVIPEPSTYAIILGALTIGFVALRRRFSKAV
jgi:hypothetical protein